MAGTIGLDELRREECLRLLASTVVGRILCTEAALPAAHPVTFVLDREEVVFRTTGGGRLAVATVHRVVGFEADEIDLARHSGWSVLGVGEAYAVTDPARLADLAQRTRWIPAGAYVVAIPLQRLTGRRLRA